MLDPAQSADLPGKASFCFRIAGTKQTFERHLPAQGRLPRPIDNAHPSAGDLLQELVIAEVAQRSPRRHGGRNDRPHRFGKALQPLASGEGEILVLLSLQ